MTRPRYWVEGWDPSYGATVTDDGGPDPTVGGPRQRSDATIDTAVEIPTDQWEPLGPPTELRPPGAVLLVDGVRRIDARVWTAEPDGASHPGVAASYAAGVVRCDLRRRAASLVNAQVRRGLFTTSPSAEDLTCGQVRYPVRQVEVGAGAEVADLVEAVQSALGALEAEIAAQVRAGVVEDAQPTDDLLVVDGPLSHRTRLPRAVGYVKTHRRLYLSGAPAALVTGLRPGQRSPVFQLGTSWTRHTWYLRLPGASGAPWSGLVRVECPADLHLTTAVRLADLSTVTLPMFAATSYKEPRAPQNLTPIAGLERRLRSRLGDATLLHRALARAARG